MGKNSGNRNGVCRYVRAMYSICEHISKRKKYRKIFFSIRVMQEERIQRLETGQRARPNYVFIDFRYSLLFKISFSYFFLQECIFHNNIDFFPPIK